MSHHDLLLHLRQTLPHAQLQAMPLPQTPAISLWLVDPAIMEARLEDSVIRKIFDQPAYWSFCWGSGQVLAKWILANPGLVKGKTVLDFGCGSGVAALAAAKASAKRVIACDIDTGALLAARANAELNQVSLDYLDNIFALEDKVDLLLAADVLYDPENRNFLAYFRQKARRIVIADSRVKNFVEPGYAQIGQGEAVTYPDMGEYEEFRRVNIYEAQG